MVPEHRKAEIVTSLEAEINAAGRACVERLVMSAVAVLSLTPSFSEVPAVANRFSGFCGTMKKPLKRLRTLALGFARR